MVADNPKDVAQNMVAVRGREGALERIERYLNGSIRSENPKSFWEQVKEHIA